MPIAMNKVLIMWLLFAVVGLSFPVHAEIYSWVDEQGRKHFGNKPPAEAQAKKLDIRPNTVSNPNRGNNSKTPAANKQVVIYAATWCGVCKRAKQYFKAHNIPYTEYDIERSRKGRLDYKKLNGRGVPIILVGDQRMDGFSPERFQALYQGG